MLEGLAGIVVGVLIVMSMRHHKLLTRQYAALLITLPIIYVAFGVFAGSEGAVWSELTYGLPFILVGLFCLFYDFKNLGYLVGVFWLCHGGFDLVHNTFLNNPGVPAWYPLFCAVVDFVVGVWLLYTVATQPIAE